MDRQRAREIIESPENIYVSYQNIPVWLDEIEKNDLVRIRDQNSDLKMEVPVSELVEIGRGTD